MSLLIIWLISICGVVSADSYVGGIELSDVKTGTVSGGIWFDSYHAMETSAEKEFTLPENTDIKWARLYAAVYCGNMEDNIRGNLTVEFDGNGDENYELLGIQEFNVSYSYPGEGGTGPVAVNDHCNRVTSDYLVWYDVKDLISSESVGVKAQTHKVDETFDGRIKAIVLMMAYDDGDGEEIMYWIKQGHDVVSHYDESYTGSASFDLSSVDEGFTGANLSAIYLASSDGTYSLNSEALTSGTPAGTYFGYNTWSSGETINTGVSNTFEYERSGTFYKIIVSAMSISYPEPDVNLEVLSLKSNANEVFASEPNTITAEIKNNGTDAAGSFEVAFNVAGSITTVEVESLDAGNSTTVEILDESIFSDGQNVNISVFADSGKVISETNEKDNSLEITETAVYNGYKGKRYTGGGDLNTTAFFEGYVNALYSSGNTAYNGAYWTEKTYYWSSEDLMIPDNADISGAYLYQGYTWNSMNSDPAFTLEFNSVEYGSDSEYMDRKYFGYYDVPSGMYVYDVTDSFSKSGNSVTLTPESGNNYAIWGGFIVVVYRQDNSGPYQRIWINEEFDNLYSYAKYAASSEEATAYSNFEDVDSGDVDSATAIAVLSNADESEKSKFFFNGNEYAGFWSDYESTSQIGFSAYDVKDALTDGANTAAMQSYDPVKGDNMYAMASILKIEYSSAPSVDLEIVSLSSNANEVFANEPNTVAAGVKNNGTTASGAFNVLFTVNGNMTTVPVSGLGAGNSTTISIIDPEIRSFGETVNITALADSGSSVTETNETNNQMIVSEIVVYNGYKGKSYTDGSDLETVSSFEGNYDLLYSTGDTAYSGSFWSEMQFNWTYDDLPVPDGATVAEARLYQPYTYNKKGSDPAYTLTFNGEVISPAVKYSDQKSFGSYDYPYGLYVFDVTDEFDTSGNRMVITNDTNNNYGIYGASLIVVYESDSEPVSSITINEEFDMLYSYSNYAVTSEEATAFAEYIHVETSGISSAVSVALLASAGDVNKSKFFFNDMEYEGFWPEYESKPQVGFSAYDVKDALTDGANTAAMQSYDPIKGDNMYAMASILKIEYSSAPYVDLEIVSLSSNANEVFANEPNTVAAGVKNNGTTASGAFNVLFTVNGNMTTVPVSGLGAGNSTTISIIDPEIRSFGETVNITALADSGSSVTETNETNNQMIVSEIVVYNGYKGKSYTDGSDLETVSSFEGHYDLLYSTGDTAYSGSFWSEMQFNWTYDDLPVPDGATVAEARLYQPYTYNKKGSDPAYTLTFNGEVISPAVKYSDQKSFGSYDYPYGLYVFDVTDEFDTSGNRMVINNDTNNNYGIYGASLIVVYESDSEPVSSITINEEFDMLYSYSNYAVTSEEATAFAEYIHVETSGISSAVSVALLASAGDVNKSKFFFNDMEYEGFWPEYESKPQVGFSAYDVKDALTDGANTAAMQSYDPVKGDNMYAMASILKIEYIDSSGPSFVVPDMSTYNNGSVTIPVFVRNITDAAGVAATITWDPSIVSVTDIVVNESVITNSSLYANLTSGYAEFAVTNTAGITAAGDVPVIDLVVKTAADKAGKICKLEGKNASWSDKSFIDHAMLFKEGTFTVTQRGDFNKNRYVDIGDVSNVAYMLAGKTPEIMPEADFNDNGHFDTGDAAKIAWYFIGRINQL